MAAFVGMVAGSSACVVVEDDPAAVQSTDATTATGTSGTEGSFEGWPEAWFGDYYADPGLPIGVPLMGDCSPGWVENIHFDGGRLTVEGFTCRGDTVANSGATYETEPTEDGLRVLPVETGGDVVWLTDDPFTEIVLRPGEACDEIHVEFVALTGISYHGRWLRGRLCLVDPFDDMIANDEYVLDLCVGATTDCMES